MPSALEIARYLTDGAERARLAGDTAASIELACAAAQYLQLAKFEQTPLGPECEDAIFEDVEKLYEQ